MMVWHGAPRRRVLMVTHCPPEAPWTGERRRVAAVYTHLCRRFECDLVICPKSASRVASIWRQLSHPLAPPYAAHFRPESTPWTECHYDLLWVFELWSLANIPRTLWSRVVWDKDTRVAASYYESGLRHRPMAWWISSYERRAMRAVRHTFLSLPGDVDALASTDVTVLPHGFPQEVMAAGAKPAARTDHPLRLGFVGMLGHGPNLRGIHWFTTEVWPNLRESLGTGDSELWIAGEGLREQDSRDLSSIDGVRLLGYVPNLDSFYRSIDVIIAPLLDGQGAPTKVMEAMGYGVPVVGTECGLRGVPDELQTVSIQATGRDWKDCIHQAMAARSSVRVQAALSRYTWPSVLTRHVDPILETTR